MAEKLMLWNNSKKSYIKPFLLNDGQAHPAVLIIPGGGYQCVCEPAEGEPIAKMFNKLGLHAFVLVYRVYPDIFPAPQQDAMRAMKIIRTNAGKWNINANAVGVCGFSAGGHLGASLGTSITENVDASNNDEFDKASHRPDFMILCYGVLSFRDDLASDSESAQHLLGHEKAANIKLEYSPDFCVTEKTPPCFIWHTVKDQMVDYKCSIYFAQSLAAKNIPFELHLFPFGVHGMLQGLDTPDISIWPELACKFIAVHSGEIKIDSDCYTHVYQCRAENSRPGPLREE